MLTSSYMIPILVLGWVFMLLFGLGLKVRAFSLRLQLNHKCFEHYYKPCEFAFSRHPLGPNIGVPVHLQYRRF